MLGPSAGTYAVLGTMKITRERAESCVHYGQARLPPYDRGRPLDSCCAARLIAFDPLTRLDEDSCYLDRPADLHLVRSTTGSPCPSPCGRVWRPDRSSTRASCCSGADRGNRPCPD